MKLLYSFLRYLRNLNLFKLQKHPFFFISETDVKMAKETQRRRIATRQSNKTHLKRWRKLKLIWINYERLTMYCFDCIFISRSNLTYWIPISVFSLVSWFLYFLQHLLSRVRRAWDLMGTSILNGLRFFIRLGKSIFYTEAKFSY